MPHTIAVAGKGGVGKSLVTTMLAVLLQREGYKVAILDADISGPSIPKAFGLKPGCVTGSDLGMFPPQTKTGIEVMSLNLLTEDETSPVVWRGPVIAGTVKQFWSQVVWGDVDYMFVDMPPGTGDVPLTVFQSLPVNGIIVVSTPQDLVEKDVHWYLMMSDSYYSKPQREEYFVDSGYYKYHEAYHLLKFANEKQILENAYQEYMDLKKANLWGTKKYF